MNIQKFVLLFVLCLSVLAARVEAKEVSSIVGGNLIISETTVIKEIPLPKEISENTTAEELHKLIKGEKREVKNMGKGKTIYYFSSPMFFPLMESIIFWPQEVTYVDRVFKSKPMLMESRQKADWFVTIFGLVTPFLIIFVLTLSSQLEHVGDKKLFLFYFYHVCALVFSVSMSTLVNGNFQALGLMISLVVSVMVNMYFAGMVTGGLILADDTPLGRALGIVLGLTGVLFAITISDQQEYKTAFQYLILLVGWMVVSFVFSKIIVFGKPRIFSMINNLGKNAN